MRINFIQGMIFLFLGMIILGLFYMQIIKGDYYRHQSMNNRIRVVPIEGPRGRILDVQGTVLADNRLVYNVGVVPQDIEDKGALFAYLVQVFHKNQILLERLYNRRKLAPFIPVILLQDIPRELAVKVEEDKFIYPGLIIEQAFERLYPNESQGAHVLGYVGKLNEDEIEDNVQYGFTPLSFIGKTGVEKQYDLYLRAQSGGRQIEVDSRGQQVRLLGLKDPLPGKDLVLTIDQRVQNIAQDLLRGQRGSIVVMDLTKGDLLSLVSSPSYDPNSFSDKTKNENLTRYFNDTLTPLLNRSISGLYPPGSVFKIPVALAALELHKISSQTSYTCPGFMMVGKRKFGCSHVHGDQNLELALAHSCNVYFFNIGQLVTPSVIGAFAKAFGLNQHTGVDLPFESRGKIVTGSSLGHYWYKGDVLNLSIGQGYTLTTPLQLTVMMAAVANNGVMLKPRVVKQIGDTPIAAIDISKRPLIRLRQETWDEVKNGLRAVIKNPQGTARGLKEISGVDIFGKTGTAQSVHSKPNHAWFVGYAKSNKAGIAFCVFLEYGGSSENAVKITHDLLLKLQTLHLI